MTELFHHLIFKSAERTPDAKALSYKDNCLSYNALSKEVTAIANGLHRLGLGRQERVAIYVEKCIEAVSTLFAVSAAGSVTVPVNPLLKPQQLVYILNDCNVKILVTSFERLKLLTPILPLCHDLHTVLVVGGNNTLPIIPKINILKWESIQETDKALKSFSAKEDEMTAILYTSGSTGKPKGVMLSHLNLVTGAKSVSQYLNNTPEDRILSVLPLSFDYGLNQLTTAFHVGATSILMNYLLPNDIIYSIEQEHITGLAAVPSIWIPLAELNWGRATTSLRYLTNSGGAIPQTTLKRLRNKLPNTKIFLMYGFTEAFRSTYLSADDIDLYPESIGKNIPNAEVFVVREDGSYCLPEEPGELVHRGPLVSLGYWNNPAETSKRFRPIASSPDSLAIPIQAAWSGDTVKMDTKGYLYFIGRRDDMIKTSGYRVSPTEIEEVIYATEVVGETVAIGVPHPNLGEAIVVIAIAKIGMKVDVDMLMTVCKRELPAFMVPIHVEIREHALPRNLNGKIDRKSLKKEKERLFMGDKSD